MPPIRKKSTAKKTAAKPSSHKTAIDSSKMSESQRGIFNKLRRKGMSERQAEAFSKHAARRKEKAAVRGGHKTKSKSTSSVRKTSKTSSSRSGKKK